MNIHIDYAPVESGDPDTPYKVFITDPSGKIGTCPNSDYPLIYWCGNAAEAQQVAGRFAASFITAIEQHLAGQEPTR